MKNLKLVSVLFLALCIAVVSCSKGTSGPAGPPGSANVEHTAWVTLAMTKGLDAAGDTVYTQTITAASITQTILDSGLVLCYLQTPGGGTITDVADFSYVLDVEISVGSIALTSFGEDFSGAGFRYVIVPGSTLIANSLRGYTKTQLKTMSYSAVSKLLGISETSSSN
jgi:hypothetical protein